MASACKFTYSGGHNREKTGMMLTARFMLDSITPTGTLLSVT